MKILIFDTETSGLDSNWNVMLQLAWQLVETDDWSVLSSQNFYFDWPKNKKKVSARAIEVNGLTQEVLAQKGTVKRFKALRLFNKDLAKADACVAHNIDFDWEFVCMANNTGKCLEWPEWRICTMESTTDLCQIPSKNGRGYKWPKLVELAQFLKIDTSDIQWHDAAEDVEVTKRCLKTLFEFQCWLHFYFRGPILHGLLLL